MKQILDKMPKLIGAKLLTVGLKGSRSKPFEVLYGNASSIHIRNSRGNIRRIPSKEFETMSAFKSGSASEEEVRDNRNNSYILGIATFLESEALRRCGQDRRE